jgi:hypothetical protein
LPLCFFFIFIKVKINISDIKKKNKKKSFSCNCCLCFLRVLLLFRYFSFFHRNLIKISWSWRRVPNFFSDSQFWCLGISLIEIYNKKNEGKMGKKLLITLKNSWLKSAFESHSLYIYGFIILWVLALSKKNIFFHFILLQGSSMF